MKKQDYEKATPIIHNQLITGSVQKTIMNHSIIEERDIEGEKVYSATNPTGKSYTEFRFERDKYGHLRPVLKNHSSQIELTISEYAEIENVFKDIVIKRMVELEHNLDAI